MRSLLLISTTSLLLAACGGSGNSETEQPGSPAAAPQAATGQRVEIKAFQFAPDPIEVKAGDKVTFVNLDGTTHDVTSKQLGVAEVLDGKNAETTITFDKAGTFKYVCTLHDGPGMRGEVVVG